MISEKPLFVCLVKDFGKVYTSFPLDEKYSVNLECGLLAMLVKTKHGEGLFICYSHAQVVDERNCNSLIECLKSGKAVAEVAKEGQWAAI